MVAGIGTDITSIERIETLIVKYGASFLEKIYTPAEIAYCGAMAFPATHYAGRWAAKEAFYKALPNHLQPESTWKSIEIVSVGVNKKPHIFFCSDSLKRLFDREYLRASHVSISHEKKYCIAFVILERESDPG
jgi:holo-[acyl-carrier protein] synthase